MERLSFKELIDKYTVVIPMLQRDYAYGRIGEEEKRENFLQSLKTYLEDSNPHELDFIYGSVNEKGELILLDGQQRMTTLFLLHWYLSLIKDSSDANHFEEFQKMMTTKDGVKFSYKTRFSSTDFCNALVALHFHRDCENPNDSESTKSAPQQNDAQKYMKMIEGHEELSKAIKGEKWFLSHWNYDPTIVSMLHMLDSIKKIFKPEECRGFYSKLINNGQLAFNFLNLDNYKLTEELYIKMNSRGRALTRFENLKAKLLKLYDDAEKKAKDKYEEKLKDINSAQVPPSRQYKSLRDYVSIMLDTKWTDVFWSELLKPQGDDTAPNIDNMMLNFIATTAIFDHILFQMGDRRSLQRSEPLAKEINDLMSAKEKNEGITISYKKFIELFEENDYSYLFHMIDYFNIFNNDGKRKKYLPSNSDLFSDTQAFAVLCDYENKEMEYEKKAKTFACLKYLSENPNPDKEHFRAWIRFACNVCSNSYSLADRTDTFCTAIAGLNYFYREDIVAEAQADAFLELPKDILLDRDQIEEEILKMKLSADADWEASLNEAENKLPYFEGHLRYPLVECCGVEAGDVSNAAKRDAFKEYVNKIAAIFPDKDGCKCENALIKALLSKGNYMMYFKSNYTLLKNAARDNSWRRFLKQKPDGNNADYPFGDKPCVDKRDYFKAVIDDPVFDTANVAESLEAIAQNIPENIPLWRKLIIQYLDYFTGRKADIKDLGVNRYVRWNNLGHDKDNYEIDLIPGSAITGYHAELFSLAKYYELKEKQFPLLGTIKYERTRTGSKQPYFKFAKVETDNKEDLFTVKIFYQDNDCFRFVFSDGREDKLGIPYTEVEERLRAIL